ncbi:helix-turn-helix transcriptional regulator [Flavobacterium salilacus subsp. salilacus]|uniref:helix-turn-helix domain-containing protein n=1 Tax=Flavobacterium TaxID=237 RepID=UPI0013C2D40F|nr:MULTISPECIES: helix-turn-helix transcriptional regulator [Flavobacterium]KAF2518769.1 helix-turn-helix transcriptional regulator [Flavobacterium salilacus subsp. salilacus]MBE1613737.1 helix-turn-helix transcriptional regulator [Flavobacterium sp. SaA2.13]
MARKKEIPEIVIHIGKRIKEVIQEKGLKVRHVAADADLDVEALRRYMAGKQVMGIDKLIMIANALGIDAGELLKYKNY